MGSILLQVKLVLVHSSNWTVNVCGHIAERMIGCCAEADSQADGEWRREAIPNHVGERVQ